MKLKTLLLSAMAGLVFMSGAQAEVRPSDTVSIVVPYGPGGGFDRAVRGFAPYFSEALGGADVITENVPGAGGQRGSTQVSRADADGLTLGIFNLPGFALPAILGEEVGYNLRELSWIGRLESDNYVLIVAADSDIQSIDDLIAIDDLAITSTGYGSTVLAALQITANQLGLDQKDPVYLSGYGGTTDAIVGLIRGDGQVSMAPVSSVTSYIESGDIRGIAMSGEESVFPGVPTFAEAGYPGLTPLNLQRSIAGPAGIDAATLAQLRAAFMTVVTDEAYLEYAASIGMNMAPLDGAAAAADIESSFEYYERFSASLQNPNQ